MRIALGADHRGFALKEELKAWLVARGHAVLDYGPDSAERVDYPDYAFKVAGAVQARKAERGILICSTGIGMSIAANRFPKVRAALCCSVRLARLRAAAWTTLTSPSPSGWCMRYPTRTASSGRCSAS